MLTGLLSKLETTLSGWTEEPKPSAPLEPSGSKKGISPGSKSEKKFDFTLLTSDQIWDDENGQLDVMKKYGTAVAPTDLAVILGGNITGSNNRTFEGDLTCPSWSASPEKGANDVQCTDFRGGKEYWQWPYFRNVSVRPVLSPSETFKLQLNNSKIGVAGLEVVEYGEYPQTAADGHTSLELERAYESKSLYPTGKSYTFDSVDLGDDNTSFKAKTYPEYEVDGKKYVRIPGSPADEGSKLSTREYVKEGKPCWVKVQPIEWLMDKSGWMVSKKCLFAGVQFDTKKDYDGDFSKTFMKKYLNTYFAKEIEPSELIAQKREKIIKGLNDKLAEISELEKVRAMVTPARTPERTEQLARITRVRRAKTILSAAARRAQKSGDKKTLQKIMEMAKPYAARDAAIRNKLHQKRWELRARTGKE